MREDEEKMIITRAPDVHLRRWLVHSAAFFKTKRSRTLPMLKSIQTNEFLETQIRLKMRFSENTHRAPAFDIPNEFPI